MGKQPSGPPTNADRFGDREQPFPMVNTGEVISDVRDVVDLADQCALHGLMAVAKVGGIQAKSTWLVDFHCDNLMIKGNITHATHEAELPFDATRTEGPPRKLMASRRLHTIGWNKVRLLEEEIADTGLLNWTRGC